MKPFDFILPESIQTVLSLLKHAGYEAYLVGGTVRDAVMGYAPHDFDITTDALPEATEALFVRHGYKVIETGLKHGTVTVMCGHEPVEITTFRIDGAYTDARHPTEVHFTHNLKEDLSRRDFTINALVYSPESGILDLFHGLSDIDRRVLRCIGNPNTRFSEDALRILRALRFSAKLDFSIEPETAKAAVELRELLHRISAERITSECLLLFEKGKASRLYSILIHFRSIVTQIFPEYAALPEAEYDSICSLASRLATCAENQACENLRFTYFLAASGVREHLQKHLRLPNAFAKRIASLSDILPYAKQADNRIAVRKLLSRFGKGTCHDAGCVWKTSGENPFFLPLLHECLRNGDCVSIAELAIHGNDLVSLGLSGKSVGDALQRALEAVMEERVKNTSKELLEYICQNSR